LRGRDGEGFAEKAFHNTTVLEFDRADRERGRQGGDKTAKGGFRHRPNFYFYTWTTGG